MAKRPLGSMIVTSRPEAEGLRQKEETKMQWIGPYRDAEANREWQAREWGRVMWEVVEQATWRLEDPAFLSAAIASLEDQAAWSRKLRLNG